MSAADMLAVIAVALRIVAAAWQNILANQELKQHHLNDEPKTAGLLRRRMVEAEKQRSPRKPAMKVKGEVGVYADDKEEPVGSIDIEIIYSLGDEPDLHLECKRVSRAEQYGPNALARYYVSGGVLRFVGKYGQRQSWGIMVALVIDGDINPAADLIARYIKDYKNEPKHLIRDWQAEKRFGLQGGLFNTLHRHLDGSSIELLHMFLPFPSRLEP